MIRHKVSINGIEVEAAYNEATVSKIFLPLLNKLNVMQKEKNKRLLVMLAAPPGAGKTTLLSFLERLSREQEHLQPIQTIGMDGFHRRQEYLQNHYVQREGKQVSMVEIKGAPVTFNLEGLRERIGKVAAGEVVRWPIYDRLLHNPVENVIVVDSEIVILEGNYLLLNEDGWRDLSMFADYTISITADQDLLRRRLIERRIKTGVVEKTATAFVDFSDMPNVQLCLEKMKEADCRLWIDEDGEYWIVS